MKAPTSVLVTMTLASMTSLASMAWGAAAHPVGAVAPGTIVPVETGLSNASAVLANLTMTRATGPGYVSANSCSAVQQGPQAKSVANVRPGQTTANLAVVPIDPDGRFCLVNQTAVDLIADVQGYLAAEAPGGLLLTLDAGRRVLDTRTRPTGPPASGSITRIDTGLGDGAAAALVNIAMVGAQAPGHVTAGRCDALAAGDQPYSSGNHPVAAAVSNLSVVPIDAAGELCIYNHTQVDLIVDVQGAFAAPTPEGLAFSPVDVPRALDTRNSATRPEAGGITRVDTGAPPGTSAVLANIAMVDADGPGYITAARCSELVAGHQSRSNGNFVGGQIVSNVSVVPVDGDGSFCVYTQRAVDLVVDVQGAFAADGSQQLFLIEPSRVLDTRPAPTDRTSCASVVHIGDSTSVGMISPSIISDPALRLDAQYRRVGVVEPIMQISGARSIVETLPGQVNAHDVALALRAGGYRGCWVFALGTTDSANLAAGSGPGRVERIERMMAAADGDPVVWVTARTYLSSGVWANTYMALWNATLRELAPRYPNLQIYDWAAIAPRQWFSGDLIHYTVEGYTIRAALIADALRAAFPA